MSEYFYIVIVKERRRDRTPLRFMRVNEFFYPFLFFIFVPVFFKFIITATSNFRCRRLIKRNIYVSYTISVPVHEAIPSKYRYFFFFVDRSNNRDPVSQFTSELLYRVCVSLAGRVDETRDPEESFTGSMNSTLS